LEGGDGAVGAVVDSIDSTDKGCVAVVNGDVTDSGNGDGLAASLRGAVCMMASAVELEGVWELMLMDSVL
jgi:hypothetical protein